MLLLLIKGSPLISPSTTSQLSKANSLPTSGTCPNQHGQEKESGFIFLMQHILSAVSYSLNYRYCFLPKISKFDLACSNCVTFNYTSHTALNTCTVCDDFVIGAVY